MSAELNKAVVRRLFEETVNQKNLDSLNEIVADDIITHTPVPGIAANRESFRQFISLFLDAFPEQHTIIDDMLVEDDKVVVRHTHNVVHRGNFLGLLPTGKSASVTGIEIYRIVDGKIAEMWHNDDIFSLMIQLGAVTMGTAAQ